MSQFPKQLSYGNIKPAGFPVQYRQTRFTPTAAINSYTNNDIVRFFIQSDGFWDPYNTFIQIEVTYPDTQQPGVALQVDSSAQGFINQFIAYNNSQEIERIEEFDQVAAMLTDLQQPEDLRNNKFHEGIGQGNRGSMGAFKIQDGNASANLGTTPISSALTYDQQCPTTGLTQFGPSGLYTFDNWVSSQASTTLLNQCQRPLCTFFLPQRQVIIAPNLQTNSSGVGAAGQNRSYVSGVANAGVWQHIIKINTVQIQAKGIVDLNSSTLTGNLDPASYTQTLYDENYLQNQEVGGKQNIFGAVSRAYGRTELSLIKQFWLADLQGYQSRGIDSMFINDYSNYNALAGNYMDPKLCGYQIPFSPYMNGGFETYLSSYLPQGWLNNGKLQTRPIVSNKKLFTIPLMSAIFGILLPHENYKYLPMKVFDNLLFEFRLNPYACFTSGYYDTNLDALGSQGWNSNSGNATSNIVNVAARTWQITKFEIWADIYYFGPEINSRIDAQLDSPSGCVLHTSMWKLGPQFPISNTSALKGSWQINMGFESLRMICISFLSNDYATYPFCRKHWRLSHNITQLQLKFGSLYLPPQPIQGHAGCVYTSPNNGQFYNSLLKCFGKLNNIWGECSINPINFALTERPYDVTDMKKWVVGVTPTATSSDGKAMSGHITTSNISTDIGYPFFHENRCIGKALYAINLEGFPTDESVISGMDTTKVRPFEIVINCDDANGTTRASMMYVWCYADVIVEIKRSGIRILGL